MAKKQASTVKDYLAALPPDRRTDIETVRKVILKHLPKGYVESVSFGALAYAIPLERYSNTYNGQPLAIACLAAQKNHNALYLMAPYGDPDLRKWLADEFRKAGKKLDMGKSCLRFKSPDDLPLPAIGQLIAKIPPAKWIEVYEASRRR